MKPPKKQKLPSPANFEDPGEEIINIFDENGGSQPEPAQAGAKIQAKNAKPKKAGGEVENFPLDVTLDEDTPTVIDLSGIKLKKFGSNKDAVTVKLSASDGTIDALSSNTVQVVGSGTGTLQLIGKRSDIQKYLKDAAAITYTGAQDEFGEGAASLTLSVINDGTTTVLATTSVNITDVSDDQTGTPQDDTLTGDRGRNTLIGLEGDDYLISLEGNDSIVGGEGNDTIFGGAGADTLEGNGGVDLVQYAGSASGVTIDLNADGFGFQQASGGDAEGDVISGFENVYGSDEGDVIIGDAQRNILFGYAGDDLIQGNDGDDVIRGGEGADTLEGGNGVDWLRYQGSTSGVTIDLNADGSGFQQASGGDAEGDVISGFENVQGSDSGDTITGNAEDNYFIGYDGDDSIAGSAGNDTIRGGEGADTMDGGDGTDLLIYAGSLSGITVDLNADGSGFQQVSGGDVISGFENVYATDFDDTLTGNSERNIFYGYDGDDTFEGGDGKDVFRGGAGADTFIFASVLEAGNVNRIIDFSAGLDVIHLDGNIFTGLAVGLLDPTQFHTNSTGLAEDAAHRIIYNSDTGHLYFDADGNGAAAGQIFGTVSTGLALSAVDFFVF